ncbi:hypothetical protein I552_7533, partial [Mycobacterium xenopi 3993]
PGADLPGWTFKELFRHVGRGDRWPRRSSSIASTTTSTPAPSKRQTARDPDEAIAWLHDGAQRLIDAVEQAGLDSPVWTFIGQRPAYWWIRRRLHEATVHRADAALALGAEYTLEPRWRPTRSANGWTGRRQAVATAQRCPSNRVTPCICTPPIRGWRIRRMDHPSR